MIYADAYERTIDAKNRIQIPAQYRSVKGVELQGETFTVVHGEAFYLCPGARQNTLSLFPERVFERRAEQLHTEGLTSEDALTFEQLYFSLASRLDMDKQGRVVLPDRLLSLVNLGKEITLTGAFRRIDLWSTKDYQEFVRSSYPARWTELQEAVRRASGGGGSSPSGG